MGSIVVKDIGKDTRFQSGTQAAEMGRKGGIKSQKLRKEKKTMREIAEMILNMPLYSGKGTDADDIKNLAAAKGKTYQ